MGYTPNKSTWLNPNIEYLFNADIIEYDMQDAGFSLIQAYHLLPDEKIRELTLLQKGRERHIAVGKLQGSDKVFSKALLDKFTEIRTVFISANHLTDNDIISVKKDALFIAGNCKRTKFGPIQFMEKHHYTSYLRFPNNVEIYYYNGNMDIKGISDEALNRHRLFMWTFIRDTIRMIESNDRAVKRTIIRFIDSYKEGALDEAYYLEFNNKSREFNPVYNYQNVLIPFVQLILKELD